MTDYTSKFPRRTGVSRVWYAAKYSWLGFKTAWKSEAAFRQELVLAVLMVPSIFILASTAVERLLMFASIALVLIVELLNSAIEATVNRVGMEIHPLSGAAKDMGSAAVLISLLFAGAVWVVFLVQYFS